MFYFVALCNFVSSLTSLTKLYFLLNAFYPLSKQLKGSCELVWNYLTGESSGLGSYPNRRLCVSYSSLQNVIVPWHERKILVQIFGIVKLHYLFLSHRRQLGIN